MGAPRGNLKVRKHHPSPQGASHFLLQSCLQSHAQGHAQGTMQPGNGSRGQLRRVKGRWQAQQKSMAQPCPLLASHLAFLNLFPRDKMGTLITSSCCKKQVNCKTLPKMYSARKWQGPASYQGAGRFRWTQASPRDSVPPKREAQARRKPL